ncbi:O-methyltransferase [Parafrigoribacterium mesophilum]|uniref:O-methyltransferase n=1 Tax=Parafrigoribacterium mesophilum TaxID=433646 RepID=UPI0031FD2197
MSESWTVVDAYLNGVLIPDDPSGQSALEANAAAGLPAIDVTPTQGKLLQLLVRIGGARRVLEIGTLGGYSTLWISRGLGDGGLVTSLEVNAKHARVARANLDAAGVGDRVTIRIGPALESLARLVDEGEEPFDFVFIDADKRNNARYLRWALKLTRSGSVIVCDNVIRGGDVADPDVTDPDVEGTREFLEAVGSEPRLDATALQTVGAKGWDGFALAVVR